MVLTPLELAVLFLIVLALSAAGTGGVRYLAKKAGWMALPRPDRWHKKPTALHGGVGFCPVFLLGALFVLGKRFYASPFDGIYPPVFSAEVRLALAMLLGSLFMFGFGFFDDLKNFRPRVKLTAQIMVASLVIFAGGIFPVTGNKIFDIPFTYFWYIGIINAVNLLDGMDGLASGVAALIMAALVIMAINTNGALADTPVIPLGLIFIASLLGFWLHNRHPAAIFMGDSGSQFIGFVLATLAMPTDLNNFSVPNNDFMLASLLTPAIPITLLAVPIFDTSLVTLSRLIRRQSPSHGGTDHSFYRLIYLGLPETRTVWLFYGLTAVSGMIAITLQEFPRQGLPIFMIFCLFLLFSGIYLEKIEVHDENKGQVKPVLHANNLSGWREVFTVLLDVLLVIICFYSAYLLRNGGVLSPSQEEAVFQALPIVVISSLSVQFLFKTYHYLWRMFSVADLPTFSASAFGSALMSMAMVTLTWRFGEGHSRSAFIIFGVLLLFTQVGARLAFRILDIFFLCKCRNSSASKLTAVLIYGAGKAGKLLFEEILDNPEMKAFYVAGFADDDPDLDRKILCGVTIMPPEAWSSKAWDQPPEIWVSSRSIPNRRIAQFLNQWAGKKPTVKRLCLQINPAALTISSSAPERNTRLGHKDIGVPSLQPQAMKNN
ncbi:MAG: hypothetical protein QME75_11195 [Deltaproteobacteria bacterium]|nr:hypothetical protein [Deltaproteobacteria bacterium]